jgi:hypothetical protein
MPTLTRNYVRFAAHGDTAGAGGVSTRTVNPRDFRDISDLDVV